MVIIDMHRNRLHPMKRSSHFHHAAFTLVETIVGAAVAVIGIGAVGVLNTAHLRYVQSSRQSNAATLGLQERVEQMRLADWRKITDPIYLKDTLYATSTRSSGPLVRFTEEVQVEAYEPQIDAEHPAPQKLIVKRNADGTRTTLRSGSGLAVQRLAKVDLKIVWEGSDGRSRTRATTTLISNGGISRMNLPGFGGTTTGTGPTSTPPPATPPPATPVPSSTPAPGSTPPPAATPPPATPPPATPTPTPTPTASGNGRGNVGGKPGKK